MKVLSNRDIAKKNFQRFTYPKDMDEEMVDTMDVLNNIPGCRTLFCCCGHGGDGWYFAFACTSLVAFRKICNWFVLNGYVVTTDESYSESNAIPEIEAAVFNRKLGMKSAAARKAEYKKICKHFLDFVPRKHW